MSTATIQLRRARPSDLRRLRQLFVHALQTDFQYFPSSYIDRVKRQNSTWRLAASMVNGQRIILVATEGKQLIGYIIGSSHADGQGELYWLYVNPAGRGQQLGRKLLEAAIELMQHHGMHIVTLLTYDYQDYYRRFGFHPGGVHSIEGVEVTLMRRELEGRSGS